MIHFTRWLLFSCVFFLTVGVYANQPPARGSYIYKTGNIQLMTEANMQLLKANLHIQLQGDYCIIEAQYDLKNNGEAKVVNYGFPIDFISEIERVKGWQDDYVLYFLMEEGKNRLPIRQQIKEAAYTTRLSGARSTPISTKLYLSDIFFEPNQIKHLTVRYKIKSSFSESDSLRSLITSYSERKVVYDMAASGYWGDGSVKNFSVSIDARGFTQSDSKFKITGLQGLSASEGFYTYKGTNVDLKKGKTLEIVYDNTPLKLSHFINEARISRDRIKSVTGSTPLRNQQLSADLLDVDFSTAWTAGTLRNNLSQEWVEVEFDRNVQVRGVAIVNGAAGSREAYYNNARIKKMTVEITFSRASEAEGLQEVVEVRQIELPRREYQPIDDYNFGDMISVLLNYDRKPVNIKKLRLLVTEVEPGLKNRQFCMSELFIIGK